MTGKVTSKNISNIKNNMTSNPTSNLTSNLTSYVTNKASQAKPKRYMPAELEDKILQLRESSLSLSETARRLADEGFMSVTGEPYGTSTISKAERRACQRKS